ncbi:MAG: GAF domain-containing protein [Salaquimonas sp.]
MLDRPISSISTEQWHDVSKVIAALVEGETDAISKMATIACELYQHFDHFDWVGFYRVVEPELLKIGPYQGGHGCLVIPFSKGVCGAAARTETTQLVPDVNAIADHIACSSTTQSEIVLPVWQDGKLIAVLDVDSDTLDAFTDADQKALELILKNAF